MSTTQWILNLTLLGWILARNLGTRPVNRGTFLVPLAVVAVAAAVFLRHVPTVGHDGQLELIGAGAGLVLGLASAFLTRVHVTAGKLVVTAGAAFATLWVVVIGGRVAFAEWATHSGAQTIGAFSVRHQITGADAWTAAFVLMALTMVAGRLLVTGTQVARRSTTQAASTGAAGELA
jgi:hypothetical protein